MPRGRPVSSMPNRQRTPGDVPGAPQYGQGAAMEQMKESAPREQAPPPRQPENMALPKPIGLFEPSGFPDEPITSGAPFGAGAGAAPSMDPRREDLRQLKQYIPIMENAAARVDAPDSLKRFVRYLRTVT
jgi:hypothetical protein